MIEFRIFEYRDREPEVNSVSPGRDPAIQRKSRSCAARFQYGQRDIVPMHGRANLRKDLVGQPNAKLQFHFLRDQAHDLEVRLRAQ